MLSRASILSNGLVIFRIFEFPKIFSFKKNYHSRVVSERYNVLVLQAVTGLKGVNDAAYITNRVFLFPFVFYTAQ